VDGTGAGSCAMALAVLNLWFRCQSVSRSVRNFEDSFCITCNKGMLLDLDGRPENTPSIQPSLNRYFRPKTFNCSLKKLQNFKVTFLVIPIHKKGSRNDCSNYRRISLLNSCYEIY
jgi:hypothetical protein